jgi:hypothetical protein
MASPVVLLGHPKKPILIFSLLSAGSLGEVFWTVYNMFTILKKLFTILLQFAKIVL